MSPHVVLESIGAVRHLRFARPDKRNALTAEMYAAAAAALREADADVTATAVLLSGEGSGFCAGNDLDDFLANPTLTADSPVSAFLAALAEVQIPLVAAVHGNAVGVGATMLLHCDVVVADETTVLSFPFVKLGLVPEAGSSLLLPRLIGPRAATRALLLGETLDAAAGERAGLLTEVVAPGAHLARAREFADRFASLDRDAVRITKSLLRDAFESVRDRVDRESALFAERLASPAFAALARRVRPTTSS